MRPSGPFHGGSTLGDQVLCVLTGTAVGRGKGIRWVILSRKEWSVGIGQYHCVFFGLTLKWPNSYSTQLVRYESQHTSQSQNNVGGSCPTLGITCVFRLSRVLNDLCPSPWKPGSLDAEKSCRLLPLFD